MIRISIPYGKETLDISVPEKNIADIVYPTKVTIRDDYSVLNEAIRNPLGTQTIEDFLRKQTPVLIIVNDATRPTRTATVLDTIERNMQTKDLRFLVATGAHRAPTEQELRMMFGKHYRNFRNHILIHDAKDNKSLKHYGKTRYGNELWLNRAVTRFERIFTIGSVEPHYFAGFTGGRKSILPGIAGYNTIEQNHKFAVHPRAQPLNIDGNPIQEEMVDCINALRNREIISVQMVLDKNNNIYEAFTGPIDKTFEMATRMARRIYCIKIRAKADIVVTVAQKPFDIDLYQTLKAIEHGRIALKESGVLIVVSPCHEGLGPPSFARLFSSPKSIEDAVKNAEGYYQLGDHNAINLASLRKWGEIWMVTRISDTLLRNAQIRQFDSLKKAIQVAIEKKGLDAKILFLINGSLTVPDIQ